MRFIVSSDYFLKFREPFDLGDGDVCFIDGAG
jgi:hypothetical protein